MLACATSSVCMCVGLVSVVVTRPVSLCGATWPTWQWQTTQAHSGSQPLASREMPSLAGEHACSPSLFLADFHVPSVIARCYGQVTCQDSISDAVQ